MNPENLFRKQVRPHLVLGAPQITFPIKIWAVAAFGIVFAATVLLAFLFVPYSSKQRLSGHLMPSSGLVDVRPSAPLRVIHSRVNGGAKVNSGEVLASACELRTALGNQRRSEGARSPLGMPRGKGSEHCNRAISLVAPVAGHISYANLAPGSDLREGELAVSIIPQAYDIIAVLFVPAQSLSNVKLGDTLKLRVSALPYQRHGQIYGIIKSISVSPREGRSAGLSDLEPFYRVEVALRPRDEAQRALKDRLAVGMAVDANLIGEPRTLAQLVF